MNSKQPKALPLRQRGIVVLPEILRRDGPVATELRDGFRSMRAELRRCLARVRIYRQLQAIDREADRAHRELAWLRDELANQENNWIRLQFVHKCDRDALIARLQQLSGGSQ